MAIAVGSHVRVSEIFASSFPGVYEVEILENNVATICGDRQFDISHLIETSEELYGYVKPEEISIEQQIQLLQEQISQLLSKV